jgi:hypothetical protein
MGMVNSVKLFLKSNYFLFKALRIPLALTGYFKRKAASDIEDAWTGRIGTVMLSPDNQSIERVSNAGKIKGDVQIMHNGIKIHVGSYYGDGNTVLLSKNKGVHEPQEEKVFEEIIKLLPHDATMLELGAFWGFYSMSFQQKVKDGINYLIEPDPHALLSGKNNFKLNALTGHFFNYYISDVDSPGEVATVTIDRFLDENKIMRLDILHSDIQGFELKMLKGASKHLRQAKIDYIFISTHSNELHTDCINHLKNYDYQILCEANLDETYSWDGLIVAKHKNVQGPTVVPISKKLTS